MLDALAAEHGQVPAHHLFLDCALLTAADTVDYLLAHPPASDLALVEAPPKILIALSRMVVPSQRMAE
eukprot:5076890-Amphidinium_carterae.1